MLGSRGSVVPTFRQQIEAGGPVTVTHPDMIRYFMTIPEAVSLILQAGAMAEGYGTYVLEMGRPVAITDLARKMIEIMGAPNVKIKFVGLRPGEKLKEELFEEGEEREPTPHQMVFKLSSENMTPPATGTSPNWSTPWSSTPAARRREDPSNSCAGRPQLLGRRPAGSHGEQARSPTLARFGLRPPLVSTLAALRPSLVSNASAFGLAFSFFGSGHALRRATNRCLRR